jgi:type I restriction enzyme M protein
MLTSETKRRIDACRDILVGKLPQPSNQVELITLALIYKFMDDLDEESVKLGGKRSFFTEDLAKYRWRNLLPQTVSADERVTLFSEGVEALGHPQKAAHLPGLFRDIFRNAFLKFRDGRILTMFLSEVNGFAYSHSEELGNAFEYLLQCTGAQGENGQFRTPRHIIDFIVACLDPQPGDKILDPACGTGGFLVSSYRHILAHSTSQSGTGFQPVSGNAHGQDARATLIPGDLLTFAQRQQVYQNLAGYDVDDQMVKLSKVNLFLHGFPDPAIHIYDTLSNDARWHEKADLILANPPFMTPKGGVTPHTKFRIAAKKAEVLFTDYIAEHLSADGRGGVIVPNGIVATTQNAYVKLRRFLVEDSLVAVVSLPAGVFKPYSGVKTSILLLDKKLARQTKEILFLKITADGFDLGDQRREIEANDLPEAERIVNAWLKEKLGSSFETSLAWKVVEKTALLEHRSASLQAESFLGDVIEKSSDHEIVRLGDVCETTSGGTPARSKSEFYEGGTIPWVKSGEVAQGLVTATEEHITELGLKNSSAKRFPVNTVLVAMYGATTGEVGLLKISATTNQAVCGVLPNERLVPEFLFYVLRALKDEMKQRAGGGAQPNISQQIIRDLEIPLPPLEEQRRIVAEIEGYQKVLDGARQILAGYRVDIEPEPDWPVVPLGDVLTYVGSGVTPRGGKSTYLTSGVLFIRSQNVLWGSCDFSDAAYISLETHAEMSRTAVKQGDVFLNITGASIGRSALYTETREANVNQHVAVLRPNEQLLPAFLTRCLISSFMQRNITTAQTGASREALNYQQIKELEIPLPPLEEQHRIVAELDAEAAQMDSVRALLPRFEAKIQRVLDRVWGHGQTA